MGARLQAIFQGKAWILEGMGENQIVLWGKGSGGEGFERVEKKEETEKSPKAERDHPRELEREGRDGWIE